ncbi:hypothetical protein P3T76_015128 [Phytophthora citrophthora]|uniref:Crinkler effector protein N-terminal domain-containing protein n=1 Tax=Phytophthora citrophthora TaxID=4793 RepID=A0AAD9LAL3_9STRA|nr:hypothetical protein P3T76_015128 [Phytophthora citrophthora]
MVKHFCALVGVAKSAFEVDIAEDTSVSALKNVIKGENSATITCDAKDLQLFLARTKDGAWLGLDEAGAASVALDKGGHPQHLNTKLVEMGSMERLNMCVGKLPDQDQVHMLVVIPPEDNAARDQFPESTTVGCLFHFKQAVKRRWQKLYIPTEEISVAMRRHVLDILTVLPHDQIDPQGIKHIVALIKEALAEKESTYSEAKWTQFWAYFRQT